MEALLEQIEIETAVEASWKVRRRTAERFDFHWHCHPEYELTFITSGTGRRFIGDSIQEYGPGDLVVIGPELPHTYASHDGSAPCEAVVVQFGDEFLGQELFDRPEVAPIGLVLCRALTGVSFPPPRDAAIDIALSGLPEQPEPERTIDLLRAMLALVRARNARPLVSSGYRPVVLNRASCDRLDDVCRYLQAHYSEPVTLSDVARVAHLSPAACSRFISRAMGRTLTEYLNELRIEAACRLLAETDRQVADIASGCGYPNLANFNRQFRRLKATTPRAYRDDFR